MSLKSQRQAAGLVPYEEADFNEENIRPDAMLFRTNARKCYSLQRESSRAVLNWKIEGV